MLFLTLLAYTNLRVAPRVLLLLLRVVLRFLFLLTGLHVRILFRIVPVHVRSVPVPLRFLLLRHLL